MTVTVAATEAEFDVYGIRPSPADATAGESLAVMRRLVDTFAEFHWRGLAAAAWRYYQRAGRGTLIVEASEVARRADLTHLSYRPSPSRITDLPRDVADTLRAALAEYRPEEQVLVEFVSDLTPGRRTHFFRLAEHLPSPPAAALADRN